MWLDAKGFDYGKDDEFIVDGCGDGGIDAIAYPPRGYKELKTVVVQSKKFNSQIPEKSLNSFFEAVETFRSNDMSKFEEWIGKKVKRVDLKTEYRNLWKDRKNLRFVLVTSGRISRTQNKKIKKLKIDFEGMAQVKALYFDMKRGKSPRPESLTLAQVGKVLPIHKSDSHGLFIFSAPLKELSKAFQRHRNNLFAGNVRYALRGAGSSDVKNGIRKTLEKNPEEFSYFHNGITVVCKKITKKNGGVVLDSPSIVNGAQTVSFVGQHMGIEVPKNAEVLVKCVVVNEIDGFEEFETRIAMSSNTQNKVSLSDLSVIDPGLVALERFFAASSCFLERKKGARTARKAKVKINKDRLLQLLASVDSKVGPAPTKDKQELYKSHAARLFEKYSSSIPKKRDAVFYALLDKSIKRSLGNFKLDGKSGKRKKNRLSNSHYAVFATMVKVIKSKQGLWRDMKREFLFNNETENIYLKQFEIDTRKVANIVLNIAKADPDKFETNAFFKNKKKVDDTIKRAKNQASKKISFNSPLKHMK